MGNLKFSNKGKFMRFITGKGFYVALAVCLVGTGAAAWVAVNRTLGSLGGPITDNSGTASFSIEMEGDGLGQTQEVGMNVIDEPKVPLSSSSAASMPSLLENPQQQQERPAMSPAVSQSPPNSVYILPINGEIYNHFSGGELVKNETLNKWATHDGIDIRAERGAEIVSIGDNGKVISVENTPLWGTVIEIEYPNSMTAYYYGLEKEVSVKAGDNVSIKQKIGTVGQIPAEILSPPHIHFAIKKDGKWVDPMEVLGKLA